MRSDRTISEAMQAILQNPTAEVFKETRADSITVKPEKPIEVAPTAKAPVARAASSKFGSEVTQAAEGVLSERNLKEWYDKIRNENRYLGVPKENIEKALAEALKNHRVAVRVGVETKERYPFKLEHFDAAYDELFPKETVRHSYSGPRSGGAASGGTKSFVGNTVRQAGKLSTTEQVHVGLWGASAIASGLGILNTAPTMVTKNEDGHMQWHWSNVGVTALNALFFLGSSFMALEVSKGRAI